jgi:PAS domain S-box-containing protein
MRISTQFKLALAIFSVLLIVITASIVVISQQVSETRQQENLANNIAQDASNLSYLSNDYVIYQGTQQLTQWQASYASFSSNVGNLTVNTPEQQALVSDLQNNEQRIKTIFDGIVLSTTNSQGSNTGHSELEVSWSRISIVSNTLISDATQLAQLLRTQADQQNTTSFGLIIGLIVVFTIFLGVIYIQAFRRTLKSLSNLRSGAAVIGSGNLDFKFDENKKDEIGELSRAFNQMGANLKNVTASKTDLEQEIVGRKQAETSLRESEQRWATTLASIGDAVIATDTSGKIIFMNGEAEELTGWVLNEVSLKPVKLVFNIVNEQTRLEVESPIERVLREGIVVGLANHTVLIRKDGVEVPIDDSGAPIKNKEGKTTGVVLIFRDITERKKAEDERNRMQTKLEESAIQLEEYASQMEELAEQRAAKLKDAERLATIGATAGMVGHDIRNPLQAITGDLFLAKSELTDLPDNDQKQNALESLGEIEKNIDYINKIVADLQDYARPLNPRALETNIKSLFNEIVTKNGIPKNIKLTVEIEDKAERIMADPDYLKRIFSNLTLNAAQAMPNGGKLIIHAFADKQTNDVLITVKDTGVGIPEDVKPKLFTPMMTTKSKGQGFGLAVVKRMTEGLGGTVTFESQEGKGTTFIVRLPPKELKSK